MNFRFQEIYNNFDIMIIFFIHLFVNIMSIIFLFLLLIYNFPIPI